MFNLIPLVLILLALVVIVIIVARKMPEAKKLESQRRLDFASPETERIEKNKKKRPLKNKLLGLISGIKNSTAGIIKKKQAKEQEAENTKRELDKLIIQKPATPIKKTAENKELTSLTEQARGLAKAGEDKKAEELYIEIIKKDPRNKNAYLELGQVYLKIGNSLDAEESFRQVLRLERGNNDALRGIDEAIRLREKKD